VPANGVRIRYEGPRFSDHGGAHPVDELLATSSASETPQKARQTV
jgi:hypothetical protein